MIRVLIIDDEAMSLANLTKMLSAYAEFYLIKGCDHEQNLSILQNQNVDVVVLNVDAPGVKAFEISGSNKSK